MSKYRPIQYHDPMGHVLYLGPDSLNSLLSRGGTAYIRYKGTARPGTLASEAGWLIKEYTYDAAANVVRIRTATSNNLSDYVNIWDDSTAIVISTITKANPGIVTTATPHGLVNGDMIEITGSNMTEVDGDGYGSVVFEVVKINATSFSMKSVLGVAVNTSANVHAGTSGNIYKRTYLNLNYV